MDEADLECHGFERVERMSLSRDEKFELGKDNELRKSVLEPRAAKWTSDNPEWEEAYVDRARQLVERDKNHPSVIVSLYIVAIQVNNNITDMVFGQ
jgi:beta-galactosidase